MTKLEAALAYSRMGWHVLPVLPDSKEPALRDWPNRATTDPLVIIQWWTSNPEYNIGILAGYKSNIVVFDEDPRNGGDASWLIWRQEHGDLPDTSIQLTPSGGEHHIVRYQDEIPSCKLAPGIDLLSDGRYFLVWPSVVNGKPYLWEASSDPFDGVTPAELPGNWVDAIGQRRRSKPAIQEDGNIIQGNRNDGLTSLAGAMRSYGMRESEIVAALIVANDGRCDIPLPESDIRQIAKSICRYEPDKDIAVNMALGSAAAESLLANKRDSHEYYLTRATAYLDQPAPIPWLIKGWIPSYGTTMIFGESGCGKTFFALDIACHLVTGNPWRDFRTKHGTVVYLAGEGNFGLRTRIASWSIYHSRRDLDNLYLSNRPIDMDKPGAGDQIMQAIREVVPGPVIAVFIDTLNRHMSGDENSARDVSMMLAACNQVAAETEAATILLHHVGHSDHAKRRERGSSAIRGSLDTSICVSRSKNNVIEIECVKMKDAPEPSGICAELASVDLEWIDEDGEQIAGAVIVPSEIAEKPKGVDSKLAEHKKRFESAWWHSGANIIDGLPYLSRQGLIDYLGEQDVSKHSIKQYLKPSASGKLIHDLLLGEIIKTMDDGWVVIDCIMVSSMMLKLSAV
jgi:hypothetical protein